MPTVLITGANRGLGLEFVRQYLRDGWRTIATCRKPDQARELQETGADYQGYCEIYPLEVTDNDAIHALATQLKGTAIDIFIQNAGIDHEMVFGRQVTPTGCRYSVSTRSDTR